VSVADAAVLGLIADTAGVSLLRGRCPAVMRSPWMCRRSWLRASLLLWLVRSSRGPCVYVAYISHCYCVHVCILPYIFHTATACMCVCCLIFFTLLLRACVYCPSIYLFIDVPVLSLILL